MKAPGLIVDDRLVNAKVVWIVELIGFLFIEDQAKNVETEADESRSVCYPRKAPGLVVDGAQ